MRMMFALLDKQSGLYMTPFFEGAAGVACRMVSDEVNRVGSDSALAKHPGDFELWRLGVWDDESGIMEVNVERLVDVSTLVSTK